MGRRRTTQRKGNAEVGGGRIMGEYIKRQDAIDAVLHDLFWRYRRLRFDALYWPLVFDEKDY